MAFTYLLSLKDKDGKYIREAVNENVYMYVRQLESYIQFPEESKLKEYYPERFK